MAPVVAVVSLLSMATTSAETLTADEMNPISSEINDEITAQLCVDMSSLQLQ